MDIKTSVTSLSRHRWNASAMWCGWRRVLGLALIVDLLGPSVVLYVGGWWIQLGRLPATETWSTTTD
jgi:hypothetical protein